MRRSATALAIVAALLVAFAPSPGDARGKAAPQAAGADAAAANGAGADADPLVKVTVPTGYKVKRVALFPVELPGYALQFSLWPLAQLLDVMESKHVFQRGADLLSNKEKTFWVYPIIDFSAGSGFGGGVGVKYLDLFHDKYFFNTYYRIHIDLSQFAGVSFAKKDAFELFGAPVSFWSGVRWQDLTNDDYFGKGPDAPRSAHSRYELNDIDSDGQFYFGLGDHFTFAARAGMVAANTGPSTYGGYPSVNTTFPPAQIPGFGRWIEHLRTGVGLIHDTRDDDANPTRGGRRAVNFSWYQGLSSDRFSFGELTFDFWQHFTLWKPGLVLSLHNGWKFQQEFGGRSIPFNRLATLDYRNMLRGFYRNRFQDRASVVFNVEYNYPISKLLKGTFFVDTGRVFNGITNFSFSDFKVDGGGGLELHLLDVMLTKFSIAYGGEGVVFRLQIAQQI